MKKLKEHPILGVVWEFGKIVVFAVVFALIFTQFVVVNATVPSGSMEMTIRTDDRIIAFRLAYLFSSPSRYDIIVFRAPDDENILNIKRVIGLSGETVEIRDGLVYINGSEEPLRSDFVHGAIFGDHGPYVVPEGHFFVLGDYRSISSDSRYWENTFVSRQQILGRAIFRYFPGIKGLMNT